MPVVAHSQHVSDDGGGCGRGAPLGGRLSTGISDGAHQQIPPVKALGNAYAAVRYRNRVEGQVFSEYESYAYPAGASIKSINDVVIIPQ